VDDQDMPVADRDRSGARVLLGALLVAAGAALLLDRLGAMPMLWRDRIWPMLLIGYGFARMLQPREQGRIGLFFVLAGAWWLAGVSGWISLEQTWPLLVVAIGISMMFQAVTPGDSFDLASRRTGQGGAPWILLAILIGAAVTSGIGRHTLVRNDTESDVLHVFSVVGRATSHPGPTATLKGAEVVTLIGGSTLDLRDLTVAPGETVTLDLFTLMGGIAIRVPDGWTLDIQAVPVLGGIRDRRFPRDLATGADGTPAAGPAPHLVVRGTVIMGGVTIRS